MRNGGLRQGAFLHVRRGTFAHFVSDFRGATVGALTALGAAGLADAVTANEIHKVPMAASVLRVPGVSVGG